MTLLFGMAMLLIGCGTPAKREVERIPLRPIRVNVVEHLPTPENAPKEFTRAPKFSEDGSRILYLSDSINFSALVCTDLLITETHLGSNIRGTVVKNVQIEPDGTYSWRDRHGHALRSDEKNAGLADLDYCREGEICGLLRSYWRGKQDWEDHVMSLHFGSVKTFTAAKLVFDEDAKYADIGICNRVSDEEELITKARAELRAAAASVLNSAYLLGIEDLSIELHLEIYEPFAVDFPGRGGGYYGKSFLPSYYAEKRGWPIRWEEVD